MRRAAALLCGGRSSRMGRPKATLPWRGRTLVAHGVERLLEATDRVWVVASAELALPPLPAKILRDREPHLGPLAGIREALAAAAEDGIDVVFVASTDAPFLSRAFVERVFELARGHRAAAPVVDGRVQPLCAAYAASLAPIASELLAADRRRPLFLLEAASFRPIEAGELPDTRSLRSLNEPREYLAALAELGPPGPATVEMFGLARVRSGMRETTVPSGPLRDALRDLDRRFPALGILDGNAVSDAYLVSLDGRQFLADDAVPVGPGDRLVLLDAATGG